MKATINYPQFIAALPCINKTTPIEDIEGVIHLAERIEPWFDRQRAYKHLAERLDVDIDLLMRLKAEVLA